MTAQTGKLTNANSKALVGFMHSFQDNLVAHVQEVGGSVQVLADGEIDVMLNLHREEDWFRVGYLTMANRDMVTSFTTRYNTLIRTGQMPLSDRANFDQCLKDTKGLINQISDKFTAGGDVNYFLANPRKHGNLVPKLI